MRFRRNNCQESWCQGHAAHNKLHRRNMLPACFSGTITCSRDMQAACPYDEHTSAMIFFRLFSVILLVAPLSAEEIDFAKRVYPVFEKNCFRCHGSGKQTNGLRLDNRADAFRGGDRGKVILPGKAEESLLIKAVTGTDRKHKLKMPPKAERLSSHEIDAIRQWIDQGAKWPDELAGERKRRSCTSRRRLDLARRGREPFTMR